MFFRQFWIGNRRQRQKPQTRCDPLRTHQPRPFTLLCLSPSSRSHRRGRGGGGDTVKLCGPFQISCPLFFVAGCFVREVCLFVNLVQNECDLLSELSCKMSARKKGLFLLLSHSIFSPTNLLGTLLFDNFYWYGSVLLETSLKMHRNRCRQLKMFGK